LFRRAGLNDIEVEATARVYSPGHSRRTICVDLMHAMRPFVLELRLASEAELDELDAAARTHFDDPDTVMMPFMFFLVSARKPGGSSTEHPTVGNPS
jgi:hypothetical protein